ncbi:MAG: hypothetical protein SPM09_09525 [Fibrobacter sp.]|nr:hypothetical protein [Fibrobacter sp.]MDY6264634.1 hypothetical protein [Fibrobacter sp.]
MFVLSKFINDSVTHRASSMFEGDIQANSAKLTEEIQGKSVCVIGGAGSFFFMK